MKKRLASGLQKSLTLPIRKILLSIFAVVLLISSSGIRNAAAISGRVSAPKQAELAVSSSLTILVDDFKPQPYQGESMYFFNRLNGDRGALNNSFVHWESGRSTVTVSPGNTWGGIWESLNHPIRKGLPINFSAILPAQIAPAYQSQITGITVRVVGGTPGRLLRLELKDGNTLRWSYETNLSGGVQDISRPLPALGNINQLVLVLDSAAAGDYVTVERISFTATTQMADTATKAFVWSYAMLLANWNPVTGLVRDSAKAASGEFDAIQSTGSLAAATALAEQLGVISHSDAVAIVNKIGDTLLNRVPRLHGLWPHWVRVSNGAINILENEEWSSIDTVIAAIGLLDAQTALGLSTTGTEQMLRSIDWRRLKIQNGISHGYYYNGSLIPYAWDTFGGESWLAALGYAAATNEIPHLAYAAPPTANGSGFIDELAWLFVQPPTASDFWGTNWSTYRASAANTQIEYYPNYYTMSCISQLGLFGLSAAEVPNPAAVSKDAVYQAFGAGGRFSAPHDGSALLTAPVVVPHYSALAASLRSAEALRMWDWLIIQGYFSPLNNIESVMFPLGNSACGSRTVFNDLKGSWNLALQTLGWGRYLAQRSGSQPIIWKATTQNSFLSKGYQLLMTSSRATGLWRIAGQGAYLYGTAADIPVMADYNGDGRAESAVFRSSNSTWYVRGAGNVLYGTSGDIPVVADYNGDGKADIAVFRPSNSTWYIRGIGPAVYGTRGDIPVVGDYDGDGKDDIAVFRPSNSTWYIRGVGPFLYGMVGDIPVVADYNGDGKADIAVFRPSNSTWYVRGVGPAVYGTMGDLPVVGDYNGDGRADIAVFRRSNSTWYMRGIGNFAYGQNGDSPVPADYNGDGRDDIAVFRP